MGVGSKEKKREQKGGGEGRKKKEKREGKGGGEGKRKKEHREGGFQGGALKAPPGRGSKG